MYIFLSEDSKIGYLCDEVIFFVSPRAIMGQDGKAQSSPWDMWSSPKLFLDHLNSWINQKLVSQEVRKLLFSAVKK